MSTRDAAVPAPPGVASGVRGVAAIGFFARLRWRLLRSTLRHGGAQAFATVAGTVVAVVVGGFGGVIVAIGARTLDDPADFLTLTPAVVVGLVIAVGIITGVAQPVDPRVVAVEPLSDRWLTAGLLTTSAVGPPGLATLLFAGGLLAGTIVSVTTIGPAMVATAALLLTLLLLSRVTVNLLALVTIRFPRAGQAVIGMMSLAFYGALQFLPRFVADLEPERRRDIADAVAWTPPGRIGRAFARAEDDALGSLLDSALAALWLPLVGAVLVFTTRRILLATADGPRAGRDIRERPGLLTRVARSACGDGAFGATAWRSVLSRVRHPRTALETVVGAGVGLGIILVPALTRDEVGASAVLVGGATQLAVIFIAGNSFGSDGPALGSEILSGITADTIVKAKVRSVLVVASPLAVFGPTLAASLSGEWEYLPAGVLVGCAGLLSGVGGAIVQATFVPVSIPESDNPLASGDTGNGLLAALVLVVVVIVLSLITLPFAVVLFLAIATESVVLVTAAALASATASWFVRRLGERIAIRRWREREPEIHDALIPAR